MTPDQMTKASAAILRLCVKFKVTTEQLESEERWSGGGYHHVDGIRWGDKRPDLNLARQLLMRYCRKLGIRDEEAGILINRCRSAVTYGQRTLNDRLDTEPRVRELWQWLEAST